MADEQTTYNPEWVYVDDTDLTVEQRADLLLSSKRRANLPHPRDPTKRIVGWVVDADKIGLGVGILALEEIERRAARANG